MPTPCRWSIPCQVTGIFAIIVCGTLGTLAIHLTAPRLLTLAEGSVSGSESSEGDGLEPGSGLHVRRAAGLARARDCMWRLCAAA